MRVTVKPNLMAFVGCWMALEPLPRVIDEIDLRLINIKIDI
jgi:hypothetical protein